MMALDFWIQLVMRGFLDSVVDDGFGFLDSVDDERIFGRCGQRFEQHSQSQVIIFEMARRQRSPPGPHAEAENRGVRNQK